MRIVFAHYLSAPFIMAGLGVLYYGWEHDGAGTKWLVPFLLIAAMIWVLAPQINWWWYSKRPPALEEGVVQALERFCGFYQRLDPSGQQKFRDRLALTRMGTEWMPKNMPEDVVPQDLQTAISTQSVIVTWNKPVFLFHNLEKVVVSPHYFLSPEHPYNHHSELYAPENCLLFSAKSAIEGFLQPTQSFNVVLYEYAKAYLVTYGPPDLPQEALLWEKLETVNGWSRQFVETSIGIAGIDPLPVAICYYYVFNDAFRRVFPQCATVFDQL